jgi:hypothetical protein
MHILMTDMTSPGAGQAAGDLAAAGYDVHSCRDYDEDAPCSVLEGRPCPLEEFPVSVAVHVTSIPGRETHPTARPGNETTVGELSGAGALCAIRRHIPLVLAGDTGSSMLAPWATAVDSGGSLASTVVGVVRSPLAEHSRISTAVLHHELLRLAAQGRATGDTAQARVEVQRNGSALDTQIWPGQPLGKAEGEALAVHVAQSVREYDPWARTIDVRIHSPIDKPVDITAPISP